MQFSSIQLILAGFDPYFPDVCMQNYAWTGYGDTR